LDLGFAAAFLALLAGFSPVTAFFAAPFFAVVVFFVAEGFFAVAVFFVVAVVFFGAAFLVVDCAFLASDVYFLAVEPVVFGRDEVPPEDFFSAVALGVLVFGAARAEVVFLAVVVFAEAAFAFVVEGFFAAGLVVGLVVFVAGLVFSLAAAAPLGASLTLPEGPFGRTNVPFSAPCVIALFS